MPQFRSGSIGHTRIGGISPLTGARAGTVNDAGGGARFRTFVIVQIAESPSASKIEPSAAQSPLIVEV